MRTHVTTALTIAMLGMTLPAQLSAQRTAAAGRPEGNRPAAGRPEGNRPAAGRAEGNRAAAPRPPVQRETGHSAPEFEPGRPPNAVPYQRDGHWYGHAAPEDPRFRLAQPFKSGRFGLVGPGHVYSVRRSDLAARRIWLPGGQFEIADWDWAVTAPWCWTCDQFVVYLDPDHPGWYMLYDVRMGEYVHAQFLGA